MNGIREGRLQHRCARSIPHGRDPCLARLPLDASDLLRAEPNARVILAKTLNFFGQMHYRARCLTDG